MADSNKVPLIVAGAGVVGTLAAALLSVYLVHKLEVEVHGSVEITPPASQQVPAKDRRDGLKSDASEEGMNSEGSPSPATQRATVVVVVATVPWVRTGVVLDEGRAVAVQAFGAASTVPGTESGPDGQHYRCEESCIFPAGYFGQLVGRIGITGVPFGLGQQAAFTSQARGELYLGINDCCDWSDNEGSFTVNIHVDTM